MGAAACAHQVIVTLAYRNDTDGDDSHPAFDGALQFILQVLVTCSKSEDLRGVLLVKAGLDL
eukprot:1151445-Pelagomonas_calceolata.AAC.7